MKGLRKKKQEVNLFNIAQGQATDKNLTSSTKMSAPFFLAATFTSISLSNINNLVNFKISVLIYLSLKDGNRI